MLIVIDVYVCYVENINKNKRKSIFKQDPRSAFGYSPLGMCFLAKEFIKKKKKAYIALKLMIARMEITQLLIKT